MVKRSVLATFVVLLLLLGACGDRAADVSSGSGVASGPFRLVASEDVYLNGSENQGRSPIAFLLVASNGTKDLTEGELLDAYIAALEGEGRDLKPFTTERDWWTYYGFGDGGEVRVGPAMRFATMATADEGYARPKFRRLVSESDEPLIVVSIDLQK